MKKSIYLDYAATTPLPQHVKEYLISLLEEYGNPSSMHTMGYRANHILSDARKSVAAFIQSPPENIYFTCGGSASNTLAIRGYTSRHSCRLLYSPIAHQSILSCAESIPHSAPLKVDREGFLDLDDLKRRLDTTGPGAFVVVDYANSEIGTIQKVEQIIALVHHFHGIIFLDCTGSLPSIPVNVKQLNADMLSFSAHKLGGLKGCGVLYKKPDIQLEPLIYGRQEKGLSGGTENIPGIASLGQALKTYDYSSISSKPRDDVYDYVMHHIPDSYLIGSRNHRLPHNLYLCFQRIDGESLTILLDMQGIQVSTGSACHSGDFTPSTTLTAIGMNQEDIHSCIRISFSGRETNEELAYLCKNLKECVNRLRSI